MKRSHNGTSNGSHSQMIRNECTYEDDHVYLEIAGQNLLFEKGFNIDTQIKVCCPPKKIEILSSVFFVILLYYAECSLSFILI